MKQIVLFASGSGSNAENIIKYFRDKGSVGIGGVFCNNPNAGVIDRARALGVEVVVFNKEELGSSVLNRLMQIQPDLIVLAGFLLKLPSDFIRRFPDRIINIHPALLPKYGGKGMYGMNVHRSVLQNSELESGISVHYVNEHYDEGNIIFAKSVSIADCSSAEQIASKVQALEHEYFPTVIEQILNQKL